MKLSVIILTHNRRDTLLHTLERVDRHTSWLDGDREIWVVDNGSTDGTAHAVERRFPAVRLVRRTENEGVWARQYALDEARGDYVCFIDDDSYPVGNALTLSLRFLDDHPRAAAITGGIVLHDGSREASALPAVPAIGSFCIRRSVMTQAGGLRPCRRFVRQAEEYDLAFRILACGYSLHRFEDVVYRHEKPPGGRSTELVHRLDIRNNLIVLDRYVPNPLRTIYREDWAQRYTALARAAGHQEAAERGMLEADRWTTYDDPVATIRADHTTLETVFQLEHQTRAVSQWAIERGIKRVCVADYGKNIYATYRACQKSGLEIVAVADACPAFCGLTYRQIPIQDDTAALRDADGVVLSNINPAKMNHRFEQLRRRFSGPVLRLWTGRILGDTAQCQPRDSDQLQEISD